MPDRIGQAGFGVLELLVFAAIFSVIAISFLSILVVVTRIQVRQTGASQVNKESVFILQFIQRYIENSSLVDMPINISTSTLTLRMSSSTLDPTKIFLGTSTISGIIYNSIYIQEGTSIAQPLTSSKVTIPSIQFIKYSNPPGHDSVRVSFTVAFNTQNITQKFNRTYVTAIARVSAATFDAGVYPGAVGPFQLGSASQQWPSINDKIYFNASNWVGIGVPVVSILSPFHVDVLSRELRVSNGDVYVESASAGIVLKSGTFCRRLTLNAAGTVLVSASSTCP